MRCSSCGTENPAGMKFCGNWAARLKNRCIAWGFENPPEFKFCGECGVSLTPSSADTATAKPTPPTARPSVRIAPERPASEVSGGERKTVTALFADIKGSMDLMEDLDPEEARATVDPALKLMMDAVHHFGGYVGQSPGDGVFSPFAAPVPPYAHPPPPLHLALPAHHDP